VYRGLAHAKLARQERERTGEKAAGLAGCLDRSDIFLQANDDSARGDPAATGKPKE